MQTLQALLGATHVPVYCKRCRGFEALLSSSTQGCDIHHEGAILEAHSASKVGDGILEPGAQHCGLGELCAPLNLQSHRRAHILAATFKCLPSPCTGQAWHHGLSLHSRHELVNQGWLCLHLLRILPWQRQRAVTAHACGWLLAPRTASVSSAAPLCQRRSGVSAVTSIMPPSFTLTSTSSCSAEGVAAPPPAPPPASASSGPGQ